MAAIGQEITPFLWFDGQTEEAMRFYVSLFEDGEVVRLDRLASGPGAGNAYATFRLAGQTFMALDGGPRYSFSPAISFHVRCSTQAEIDHLWEKLGEGGEILQCGWLRDRFGVTWQIVPAVLGELLQSGDPARSRRVMDAMLKMVKLDIATLQRAYDNG